jgi:hypothetical protein
LSVCRSWCHRQPNTAALSAPAPVACACLKNARNRPQSAAHWVGSSAAAFLLLSAVCSK